MSLVKKQILVAVTNPKNRQPLQFLENANAVFYAATMVEAKTCLIRPMDLVIYGANFDGSRMFELLSHVKTLPIDRRPPVICLRQNAGKFDANGKPLTGAAKTSSVRKCEAEAAGK